MPFTGIKEPVFRQGLDISCAALLHHIRVWPGEEKHALAWKERNAPHDIFHWSARCMIASTEETKNPHEYRKFIGISAGFG
jgi:hypothetical protein